MIIDSNGRKCESIKWHSRQKHAFLEEYLKIWYEQVGKNGRSIPTLAIYDLFASYGWCHCHERGETWKGSALLAAECLEKYQNGKLLFLNTYHPAEEELLIQKNALEKSISDFHLPSRIHIKITSLPLETAVEEAISNLDINYPSLWILDPYQPDHLPWNIVERICQQKGSYKKRNKDVARRPELFVNLITSTLHRYAGNENLKKDLVGITLGMEKDEWKQKYDQLIDIGKNAREALIIIYATKLAHFYEKEPIILDVPSVSGNIVYTVFLCTDNDAGHYVMKLQGLPKYHNWNKFEWEGVAKTISKQKKIQKKAEQSGHRQIFFE